MSRAPRLRLSVGRDRAVLVVPDGTARHLAMAAAEPAALEELSTVLERLADERRPTRMAWTLLPPLVDVRQVQMPRLRPEETTAALERHAGRYFPAAREDQVVAWRTVERPEGAPAHLLAAAAPVAWLERVRSVIAGAGFRPDDPVPATEAWLAAARAAHPPLATGAVVVSYGDRVVVVGARDGLVVDAAVLPAGAEDRQVDRLREMADGGPVVVLGDGVGRAALETALVERPGVGLEVVQGPREDGAVLAARYADHRELALVSPMERTRRRRREQGLARGMWAATLALVVLAGLLELWGVNRELGVIRAERAERADAVSAAMAERDAVDALHSTVVLVDSLERTAPAWAGLVADLADHLPADAHLAALRGEPDSVSIEGVAADAAGVFAALRRVPGVHEVRARAPIRRQEEAGGAVERFSLAARLGDSPGVPRTDDGEGS